ncbi:gamma-aminobutyric acid type B receptor subunit 2 [Sitophilus oryzae]|uniref:Gamma-aminobutyric acid type B receptor subunit 2 n=1 Tax=Sitophilus oryzae TaxID=7048 RepID=A0A6J2YVJ4_SITOR|nr:gamma-aminobutyric acid type B receptor subunit 2 [Sitophilus oryzae]
MVFEHPYQRSFCVLFISLAIIVYFTELKQEKKRNNDSTAFKQNEDFSATTNIIPSVVDNRENFAENSSGFIFNTLSFLDDSFDLGNLKIDSWPNEETAGLVYILGLFELTSDEGRTPRGETELMAAKMAVKHVNALNVLPGYKLQLLVNDTKCDPGVAIDRLFHAIYSEKTVTMLLGSGCSNVSEALAHIVPYWNILQVSYGSKSPSLSDTKKFPLFFRTIAPDSSHDIAKVHFIKHFNWQVVATFSESENAYLLPVNKLITDLEKENISCAATVTFSIDNYKDQLKILKSLDIRIIISSFSSKMASKIFCAIYELNMYGNEYVWILERQEDKWWEGTSGCSQVKLKQATEGVITVGDFDKLRRDQLFNETKNETYELYRLLSETGETKNARLAYDAIWTMALTLRESHVGMLEDFNYNNKEMACLFVKTMRNLEFIGISGPIKFTGADRVGDFVISQIQDGRITDVALYDSIKDKLNFACNGCQKIYWYNGLIPIAQRILKETLVNIPNALYIIICGISLMGIAISLVFLYFNMRFRQLKTVKLSSPNLNNIAVVGCILVYISVVLYEVHNITKMWQPYADELCSINVYLLSAGFSLTFGSIFAKTYRVHRLFAYTTAGLVRDKLLKDQHLIGLILIPLFIDTAIMSLWLAVDPLNKRLYNLLLEISPDDPRVVYQPQIGICQCQNTIGWFIALFGYKGLILIMGAYMAWKTRHVKVPALNDSHYIGICVYSCVFCTVIVIVFSFVTDYFILSYIAKTTSILISTTIVVVLMFVPKLKSIFCKVDEEVNIMQTMGLKVEYNTRRFIADDSKEALNRLEIQNRVYKARLEDLDKEIAYLEDLLKNYSSSDLNKAHTEIFHVTADLNYFRIPRSSWPTWDNRTSIKQFSSEHKLNNVKISEKLNILGKLKRLFGSITSLGNNKIDSRQEGSRENEVLRSNPEIFSRLYVPVNQDFGGISSEACVRKSY